VPVQFTRPSGVAFTMTLRLFKSPVSAERWGDSIPAGYSCGLRGGRNIITVETGAGEPQG
jgi:hypothetical protein